MINLRFIITAIFVLFNFVGCAELLNNQKSLSDQTTDSSESMALILQNTIEENIQNRLDEALDFCQLSQAIWQKGELENAIDALDKAYSLILNINTQDFSKLDQQKEDLRFMISKRILEIYASRNIVVNGNHDAIPMMMNTHVERQIISFTSPRRERNFFIKSYKRSGKYRDRIVELLKEAGLPEELSWLPLIESGFQVSVLSKARALGLWQFIPSTGYKFGLKRNTYIDERLNPLKSTKAAIAYLKELHRIFGDWTTVMAAYNCGEGRVLKLIRAQNINYLDNFWDLYQQLPRETSRYVPRFMATLYILKEPEKYGLDKIELDDPIEFETVSVSRHVRLKDIAEKIDVPKNILIELNSELRYRLLPKEEYELKVPLGKGQAVLAKIDEIPIAPVPRPAYVYHRIKEGDTLSTIAERYKTSVSKIMRANNLNKSNYIVAGKKIKVPQKGMMVPKSSSEIKTYFTSKSPSHKVKAGDSLWILARRYHTTTRKIQAINNLKTTRLHIGQILKIPSQKGKKTLVSKFMTYKVKQGDSPYVIAMIHKMPLKRFLSINNLMPGTKIYPNQNLYVE